LKNVWANETEIAKLDKQKEQYIIKIKKTLSEQQFVVYIIDHLTKQLEIVNHALNKITQMGLYDPGRGVDQSWDVAKRRKQHIEEQQKSLLTHSF
jgi:hypothetical protein